MANFDKDKSIKPFAGDAQEQIKDWRKGGFFKKLEPHEVKLAQKLSRVAEALFDQVAEDLAKTREAANDEITLWPSKLMPGNKGLDFHGKEHLTARLTGADHAVNTLPYKRLKTAMDAWCALWLWPLEKADQLPSRPEFLQGMAMILEGGFTPDGSLAAPSVDEFVDPAPDFLDQLEPDAPARDLFKAAEKRQDNLFRETNVEELIETFDWLGVAVEVAERERFVHFDLIFADVMKARGGFDLIVGNPPWAKPSWNEGLVLADIDPLYAGLSASDAKKVLADALPKTRGEKRFLREFVSTRGAMEVTSSEIMNPFAGGGSNNLYRCFIDLSFRLASTEGYAALIHQDGHLGDPKSGMFRRHWYGRIARHFSFVNEITTKNFSEVAPYTRFSLNIYRGQASRVEFLEFSNAYAASQVEDSFSHDGLGSLPGIRNEFGKIDISGHQKRITKIDKSALEVIHSLSENDSVPLDWARFIQPYSTSTLEVFRRFACFPKLNEELVSRAQPSHGGDLSERIDRPSWQIKNLWGETSSQKDGTIKRQTNFVGRDEMVIQGPHFHVGNPLFKTPKRICRKKEDYEVINLLGIPDEYRPRVNYSPALELDTYQKSLARCSWDGSKAHTDFFRVALRNMINLNSERSLICSLIPPKIAHIHTVESVAFADDEALVNFHALSISLPFDFLVKASGREHISVSDVAGFPYFDVGSTAKHRALRLGCLTSDYKALWDRVAHNLWVAPWSTNDPRLSQESPVQGPLEWGRSSGLRTDFGRRLALIEIDVLVSQALGLTLDQLVEIYRIYFPVLQRKESKTYFDSRGNIVYVSAKGMETVGYINEKGKTPSQKEWQKILAEHPSELTCTAIDDTMPGGPREVTRHFVAPFTRCDRIEDYKRAWAHFERLKTEGAV